jgi:hypothetical protein
MFTKLKPLSTYWSALNRSEGLDTLVETFGKRVGITA